MKARDLDPEQVADCVPNLYHSMSKYAHGNDGTIILKASYYAVNELAALVVFLRLQSTWSESDTLAWREVPQDDIQDIALDATEKALGVEGMGTDGEATKEELELAGAVDTLLAMEEEAKKAEVVDMSGTTVGNT